MEDLEEYTARTLAEIQKELPDCVGVDADEAGLAVLLMDDGKTMMQQEFEVGAVKVAMLKWNIEYLLAVQRFRESRPCACYPVE